MQIGSEFVHEESPLFVGAAHSWLALARDAASLNANNISVRSLHETADASNNVAR